MKNNVVKVLLALVFLVVFNILFFVIGGVTHSTSCWISYAFIHLSYACILLVPVVTVHDKGTAVLTGALYLVSLGYFVVELIVGSAFIFLGLSNITIPLIIQLVIFAVFAYKFLLTLLANDQTYKSMRKQKLENFYIQSMAQNVRSFIAEYKGGDYQRIIEKVYNSLNESSLESFPEVAAEESKLRDSVDEFCDVLENKKNDQIESLGKKVLRCIQDRNTKISLLR